VNEQKLFLDMPKESFFKDKWLLNKIYVLQQC